MIPVARLSHGWRVVRDAATGYAFFEGNGRRRDPHEFAGLPEARTVFRDVKRRLDVMDATGFKGDDMDWRAMDRAKIALEVSLRFRGRWSPDLADTGI